LTDVSSLCRAVLCLEHKGVILVSKSNRYFNMLLQRLGDWSCCTFRLYWHDAEALESVVIIGLRLCKHAGNSCRFLFAF